MLLSYTKRSCKELSKHYLSKLVLQHLLWRADVCEEHVQKVSRSLRIYLLFTKIDISNFNGFSWSQAQHLLRMDTAFKYFCKDLPGTRDQFLT